MLSNRRLAIIAVLFLLTRVVLTLSGSVIEPKITKPFEQFPHQIGKWKKTNSHVLSYDIINILKVDNYFQYGYLSPDGPLLDLYVSYFKNVGGGGGYHSPKNCLVGAGWDISFVRRLKLKIHESEPKQVQINIMVLNRGAEKQVVVYWFQNRGRIIASEYWEKIYLLIDSLIKHRRDGSFIRITAFVHDNKVEETISYASEFAKEVILLLEDFLPGG